MSKRTHIGISINETPGTHPEPLAKKKRPGRKYCTLGCAVTMYCQWRSEVQYEYHSFTRGVAKSTLTWTSSQPFRHEFTSLPKDWQDVVRRRLVEEMLPHWKAAIMRKHDLYGTFESWNIKTTVLAKLSEVEICDPTAVDMSPDRGFFLF